MHNKALANVGERSLFSDKSGFTSPGQDVTKFFTLGSFRVYAEWSRSD
jgi:hypothetical protein